MNVFFVTPERLALLRAAADKWIGTPFHPHGTLRGPQGGCSCETLVAGVYKDAGFAPPGLTLPKGSLKTGHAIMMANLREGEASRFMRPVDPPQQPGDLLLFRHGRRGHMGVIVDDARFIHCLLHHGVAFSRLDDAVWLQMERQLWRPIEQE